MKAQDIYAWEFEAAGSTEYSHNILFDIFKDYTLFLMCTISLPSWYYLLIILLPYSMKLQETGASNIWYLMAKECNKKGRAGYYEKV